ncbi:MAG: hypothetical protein HUU26_11365 [Gemmatimonadaceae bacterium]|nr:hypothetical protein [Gemmatimonadaceae bacterium]
MRYHLVLAMAMAVTASNASAQAGADPDRAVAGSGIQVRGWQGRTDRAEQRIADVRFVAMGTGYHLTNGPHAILWHQDNVATGDYTVRARLTKTPRSTSTHEESYGVFIGGSDLTGPRQNYLYCVVFGTGTVMVRHRDGADTHTLMGKTANASVSKMSDRGATDEVALWVRGGRVGCSVNGTEVFSAARADMIGPGKLVSTDGVFGVRASHNLDLHIEGPTISRP